MASIDVDIVAPKNSATVRLDMRGTSMGYTSIYPYTATVSAPFNLGTTLAVGTCTGTVILDGNIFYLCLNTMTFTSTTTQVGTSNLLVGTDFIPSETCDFPMLKQTTSTKAIGNIKISTTGVLSFYRDANETGWTDGGEATTIYPVVLKYSKY
jgi:purine-nucleoside phosphorylase